MNIPEDCVFAYTVSGEAWYSDAADRGEPNPYLMVQAAAREGGVAWEFKVTEHRFNDKSQATRVEMFDDSYIAWTEIPEFFSALIEGRPETLGEVRAILNGLGAQDITQRIRPSCV